MYQNIMVPLDGSKLAECVLPHVESIVKAGDVRYVSFVRVAESFDLEPMGGLFGDEDIKQWNAESKVVAGKYLEQLVSQLDYGRVKIKTEVLTGRAAESLADYATKNEVDLIVIATHGRSGISRWVWGSIADRILHSSCVPILMVRAPGCIPGF